MGEFIPQKFNTQKKYVLFLRVRNLGGCNMYKKNYKNNYNSKSNESDKTNEIEDMLVKGVMDTMTSEKFKQYLDFQSKFYKYSFNNCMLILSQCPNARFVAGYKDWQKLGRHITSGKGSGIKIFVHSNYQYFYDIVDGVEKKCYLKYATKEQKGKIARGLIEVYKGSYYPILTVFDVSQTEGKELPTLCKQIQGDSEEAQLIIDMVTEICDIPIKIEKIPYNGCFYPQDLEIHLKHGLGKIHQAKTLIHEFSHYYVYNEKNKGLDLSEYLVDSNGHRALYAVEEIIVESIAYITGQHFGIDTSEYSFEYITSWSKGDVSKIKKVCSLIQKFSQDLIEKMSKARTSLIGEEESELESEIA